MLVDALLGCPAWNGVVLGARKQVKTRLRMGWQVLAKGIRVYQGTAPLPVLRCGLSMYHNRVSGRSLQNAIGLATQRVCGDGIRKGELV
jgi:hypothetical protein